MKKIFKHNMLLLFLTLMIVVPACGPGDADKGVISAPNNQGVTEADSQDSNLPSIVGAINEEDLGGGKIRYTVKFSEAIDPATVTDASVGIYEVTDNDTLGTAIAVALSWESDSDTKLQIDTTAALDPDKDYVLKITQDVQDAAGNPLDGNALMSLDDGIKSASDYLFELQGGDATIDYDLDRPRLSSVSCLSSGSAVYTDISDPNNSCASPIGAENYYAFTFSKDMDVSTINSTNISISYADSPDSVATISGTWYVEYPSGTALAVSAIPLGQYFDTFYFQPAADLVDGQMYTLTLNHDAIKGAAVSDTNISYTSWDDDDEDGTDNSEVYRFYAADDPSTTPGPIVSGIEIETDTSSKKVKIYFSTSNQDNNLMDTTTLEEKGNVVLKGSQCISWDEWYNCLKYPYLNFIPSTYTETLGGFESTVLVLELADKDATLDKITITDDVTDASGNKLNGDGDNTEDEYDNYPWSLVPSNVPVILGEVSVTPTTVTAATSTLFTWDAILIDYDAATSSYNSYYYYYTVDIEVYNAAGGLETTIGSDNGYSYSWSNDTTSYINGTSTVMTPTAPGSYIVRYTVKDYLGNITAVRETNLTVN